MCWNTGGNKEGVGIPSQAGKDRESGRSRNRRIIDPCEFAKDKWSRCVPARGVSRLPVWGAGASKGHRGKLENIKYVCYINYIYIL